MTLKWRALNWEVFSLQLHWYSEVYARKQKQEFADGNNCTKISMGCEGCGVGEFLI